MNERPYQVRQEAAGAQPAPLQNRIILAHDGHIALVEIVERALDLPPLQLIRDQPPDVPAFLNRRLRHAGHRMSFLHDRRRVADDEYSGRVQDLQERVDKRPSRAVDFGTEHLWSSRCGDTRGPQHGGAWNPLSAGDNALLVDGLDLDSGQDPDAE